MKGKGEHGPTKVIFNPANFATASRAFAYMPRAVDKTINERRSNSNETHTFVSECSGEPVPLARHATTNTHTENRRASGNERSCGGGTTARHL